MLSEKRLKEIDEAFDFIRASWHIDMEDFRHKLVKKCKKCKKYQEDVLRTKSKALMVHWTKHVAWEHLNV